MQLDDHNTAYVKTIKSGDRTIYQLHINDEIKSSVTSTLSYTHVLIINQAYWYVKGWYRSKEEASKTLQRCKNLNPSWKYTIVDIPQVSNGDGNK